MQEIKRVVNIRWIIFVCLLLLINAIFIFNNNKEGIEVYVNYNEMIQMTMDKKTDSISNRDAATQAWTQYFDENNRNIEQWEEPDNKITSARTARKMLMSNADYIDEFRNMIDRKISESENILKAGMYEEGSFENKNGVYFSDKILWGDTEPANGNLTVETVKTNDGYIIKSAQRLAHLTI